MLAELKRMRSRDPWEWFADRAIAKSRVGAPGLRSRDQLNRLKRARLGDPVLDVDGAAGSARHAQSQHAARPLLGHRDVYI